jgi:hypothetical protein
MTAGVGWNVPAATGVGVEMVAEFVVTSTEASRVSWPCEHRGSLHPGCAGNAPSGASSRCCGRRAG